MLKRSISLGIIASLIERRNAELSFLDLKGIDALVDYPGASPLYGYVALRTFLPSRRFFGNYGPGNAGLCGRKGNLAAGLKAKNDCPLDDNSELVQRLFPSPDGINFVANQVPSDIVTRLNPFVIGRILERLSLVNDQDWNDDRKMKELESDLTEILFEQINEKRYVGWKFTILQTKAKRLAKTETFLAPAVATFGPIPTLVDAVVGGSTDSLNHPKILRSIEERLDAGTASKHDFEILESMKRRMQAFESEGKSSKDDHELGQYGDFVELANLVVRAVRESRLGPSVQNGESYPKYMPEHALLAFFIRKADSKLDLIHLFDGMGSLVKNKDWFNKDLRKELVDEFRDLRWSTSELEFYTKLTVVEQDAMMDQFFENYDQWSVEKLMFYLISIEQGTAKFNLPRAISYDRALSRSLDQYSDCGETSLRNFFNFMLYDFNTNSFKTDVLREINKADREVDFDPAIESFYKKFPSVDSSLTLDARNEWDQTIVENREGIVYRKGRFEIKGLGNPDNMLNLIGQLLFQDPNIRERRWTSHSRDEKLNTLCQIFSTDARQITWEYSRNVVKDFKGVKIDFKFNEDLAFTYTFDIGHYAIWATADGTDRLNWRFFLLDKGLPPPEDNRKFLVPLVVDSTFYYMIEQKYSSDPSFRVNLFYALDLSGFESQIVAFDQSIWRIKKGLLELKHVANRIRSKLPEDTDIYTARRIEDILRNHGYPLGYPAHTRNRPYAIYRPVPETELVARFGVDVAKQMGATFGRFLFGKTELLISDVLKEENGKKNVRKIDQNGAKQLCIDLNPAQKQAQVQAEIESRELAISKYLRDRDESTKVDSSMTIEDCSVHGPIAKIINDHPISGFYLLSMVDFGCIYMDMGWDPKRGTDLVIAQILPNINQNTWTSTSTISTAYPGFLAKNPLHGDLGVRCGINIIT